MSFAVQATPVAQICIGALRGRARQSYERKLKDIAARGCRAFDYRLTGTGVEWICVAHLTDSYRLLGAFPDREQIVVLLVARHSARGEDVYRLLYDLLELAEPDEPRTKPPCCDDGSAPPVDEEGIDAFLAASNELRDRIRRARLRLRPS